MMNRDQAILLAQRIAYERRADHPYLPQTETEAIVWKPHEWVIRAIQGAVDPVMRESILRATLPPPPPNSLSHVHGSRPNGRLPLEPIHFSIRGSQKYRACSWCGSAHPADLAQSIRDDGLALSMADMKYGWPHKFYMASNKPNPQGFIKFYSLHLQDATSEDRVTIEKAMGLHIDFDMQRDTVSWRPFGAEAPKGPSNA